jgi:hypothetical protein
MPSPPDGERRRPGRDGATLEQTKQPASMRTVPEGTDDVPLHRPWARRADARAVERRYRRDQAALRRRIDCARRTSHDGRDELAPAGRWSA